MKDNDLDILDAQNNVDMAYEEGYRIAKRVRNCPDCDCGWEEAEEYQPHLKSMATVMRPCRSCNWQRPWREAMGRVKAAKRAYRKLTDCEPYEPIRQASMGNVESLAFFAYPSEPTEDERDRGFSKLAKIRAQIHGLGTRMDMDAAIQRPSKREPEPMPGPPPDEGDTGDVFTEPAESEEELF